MTTLFVQDLTVMDFSYIHPDRGLLGESWIVDIELTGELDNEGVIFDFAYAKKAIKTIIDTEFDHKLVVPRKNQSLKIRQEKSQTRIKFSYGKSLFLEYSAPESSYCFLNSEEVSHSATIKFLQDKLTEILPSNIEKVDIVLRTENIDGAYYHYSHGLKKHYGNCQRMAHGHRSRITIFENSKRNIELEHLWANVWKDIYIGTREDFTESININNEDYFCFKYTSKDGSYFLKLPKRQCYLIDTDSTVEFLAHHIANKLKLENSSNSYKVIAFEGVKKGAVAIS